MEKPILSILVIIFTAVIILSVEYRKKIAAWLVTLYAKWLFDSARRKADKRYEVQRTMIYVAHDLFNENVLTTYDKRLFKSIKHNSGSAMDLMTLQSLKHGCYYHTPDRAGNQAMTPEDAERRRRYFIRERLEKAKLL